MTRPVIALLTDFGLRDHYVAAMKGVVLGICPDATLVDISHDIRRHDILAGALELEAVAPYLPPGTVVVAVVDPGVGSERRGVAIEAGDLRLVGPDNGLLSRAAASRSPRRAVTLNNPVYARVVVSRTFEGRDRFAPAAAWLASGVALDALGPPANDLVQCEVPDPEVSADGIDGVVLRIDHFGNLITNLHRSTVERLHGPLTVRVAGAALQGVSQTYAESAPGALCAIVGSTERIEIAVNGGSAASLLGVALGAAVQVRGRARA